MKKFTFLFLFAFLANLILAETAFGQITPRASSSNSTTSSTLTINNPGGLAVGDVMFANIVQGDENTQVLSNATRSGWTLVRGAQFGINGTDSWWGTVLYKIADAADVAAASFVFTLDGDADATVGGIVAFYNVDINGGVGPTGTGVGPFDVAAGTLQGTGNSNSTTITAPAITTNTNNAAVIMFGMGGDNSDITNWLTLAPGSLTLAEILDANLNSGIDETAGAAWALLPTAGGTGTGNATFTNDRNGGVMVALKPITSQVAALVPFATISSQNIAAGGSVSFTAMALNFGGSGNYSYQWNAPGATIPGSNPSISALPSDPKTLTFPTAGTYSVDVTISRTGATTKITNTITVNVYGAPSAPNLWAINGTNSNTVSTFSVNGGFDFGPGPTSLFTMGAGTPSAALALSDKPTPSTGYFYWLTNTNNNGTVNVYGSTIAGGTQTFIGSLDVNGGSNNSLGFVRIGMRGDGTAWILAGDGTTLYLASFKPNGVTVNASLPLADRLAVVDASVQLTGGSVATFQNGDLCFAGDGNLVALANSGGTTQIFTGSPNGASTVLVKKFDVLDQNSAPFSGSVNGIAFDFFGSLYVSASSGLYYIDKNTVDGPAATINISQVWAGSGLTDLATNFFPFTIVTPVKLTTFTVTKQGSNAILNWTTASEINSDHFEIERSYDGVNFVSVGTKLAAGNSSTDIHYSFIDPISISSGIIYYRIKTVDFDDTESLSKIVALRLNGGIVKNFTVYPNPFSSDLKIEMESAKDAAITVRISNALGQAVVSRNMLLQKGNNVIVLSAELAALKAGMYVVEIIDEDGRQAQKIIKR